MRHVPLIFLLLQATLVLAFLWARALIWVGNRPEAGRRLSWMLPASMAAHALYALGDLAGANRLVRHRPAWSKAFATAMWNTRVCVLVASGQYRAALRAGPGPFRRGDARRKFPIQYAVIVINQVEALYCLGRWQRAERLMQALIGTGLCGRASIALAGGTAQLAWVLASTGRAAIASWLLDPVLLGWLPPLYQAELIFTRARASMELGRLEEAATQLGFADQAVRRASSRRNALFLRARLWAAMGRVDEAIVLCRAAADSKYQGQGGDGLLLWGDLLKGKGQLTKAQTAWQLAVQRDAESESARTAVARLAS